MLSSKKYISKYIILKILNDEYKKSNIIPSENRLAIKFNCSRLTARSALINLVDIGVLQSKQGMGYLVSDCAMSVLFYSNKLKCSSNNSMIEKIRKLKINALNDNSINCPIDIFCILNYDSLANLTSISYIIINKDSLSSFYKENYDFSKDPINQIISLAIAPSKIKTTFLTSIIDTDHEKIEELGHDSSKPVPIILQEWHDTNGEWTIKTVNILKNESNLFWTTVKL